MNDNKDLLTSILNTAQLGQAGIRSALGSAMRPGLRKALESQLKEFDSIETEAHEIAASRGWELRELEPATRLATGFMTKLRLSYGNTDSRLAAMMISENTRGMIQCLTEAHQVAAPDVQIASLSQKLLDSENANIRQMQGFL